MCTWFISEDIPVYDRLRAKINAQCMSNLEDVVYSIQLKMYARYMSKDVYDG